MAAGITVFMVTDIVSVKEGLEGFLNEGVLTMMVLFVVAKGISRLRHALKTIKYIDLVEQSIMDYGNCSEI
jgi:hypothetical protein